MKVLHVINSLSVGGAQKLVVDILPLLARHLDVELLVLQDEENAYTEKVRTMGIPVRSLHASSVYNPLLIRQIRSIIRNYEVVHVHLFPSSYWVALAAKGLAVKLVFTEHSTSNKRRQKWYLKGVEQFIYRRYDRIACISPETKQSLQGWLQDANERRFPVIDNGIDIRSFLPRESKERILGEGKPCRLVMVSRFMPAKDQDTVIRALQHMPEEVTLDLVGDGDRRAQCEALAAELGVQHRVAFLGTRTDIPELLHRADIGIQSSHWEGFGLTAVEMMAAGLPVVATRVPGLQQVVEGAGLLFAPGNVASLSECIRQLMTDQMVYGQVQHDCVERAEKYDIRETASRYENLYRDLLGNQLP